MSNIWTYLFRLIKPNAKPDLVAAPLYTGPCPVKSAKLQDINKIKAHLRPEVISYIEGLYSIDNLSDSEIE